MKWTKIEFSTFFGTPACFIHLTGDSSDLPDELVEAARELLKNVQFTTGEEWKEPIGAQVALGTHGSESVSLLAVSIEDILKFGTQFNIDGTIELEY